MKGLYLHIIFWGLMLCLTASGQVKYKPLKVDVGILAGEVTEYKAGLLMPYIEPKFNITNAITAGLRLEYVNIYKEDFADHNRENIYYNDLKSSGAIYSSALTVDYYFNQKRLRPFAGGGVGLYYILNKQENPWLNIEHNFVATGFFPRLGFNIDHFRFSAEYNFIPNNKIDLNYLTFKIGFEIGGGKKLF